MLPLWQVLGAMCWVLRPEWYLQHGLSRAKIWGPLTQHRQEVGLLRWGGGRSVGAESRGRIRPQGGGLVAYRGKCTFLGV